MRAERKNYRFATLFSRIYFLAGISESRCKLEKSRVPWKLSEQSLPPSRAHSFLSVPCNLQQSRLSVLVKSILMCVRVCICMCSDEQDAPMLSTITCGNVEQNVSCKLILSYKVNKRVYVTVCSKS